MQNICLLCQNLWYHKHGIKSPRAVRLSVFWHTTKLFENKPSVLTSQGLRHGHFRNFPGCYPPPPNPLEVTEKMCLKLW